jgi:hypothetical protein
MDKSQPITQEEQNSVLEDSLEESKDLTDLTEIRPDSTLNESGTKDTGSVSHI